MNIKDVIRSIMQNKIGSNFSLDYVDLKGSLKLTCNICFTLDEHFYAYNYYVYNYRQLACGEKPTKFSFA